MMKGATLILVVILNVQSIKGRYVPSRDFTKLDESVISQILQRKDMEEARRMIDILQILKKKQSDEKVGFLEANDNRRYVLNDFCRMLLRSVTPNDNSMSIESQKRSEGKPLRDTNNGALLNSLCKMVLKKDAPNDAASYKARIKNTQISDPDNKKLINDELFKKDAPSDQPNSIDYEKSSDHKKISEKRTNDNQMSDTNNKILLNDFCKMMLYQDTSNDHFKSMDYQKRSLNSEQMMDTDNAMFLNNLCRMMVKRDSRNVNEMSYHERLNDKTRDTHTSKDKRNDNFNSVDYQKRSKSKQEISDAYTKRTNHHSSVIKRRSIANVTAVVLPPVCETVYECSNVCSGDRCIKVCFPIKKCTRPMNKDDKAK